MIGCKHVWTWMICLCLAAGAVAQQPPTPPLPQGTDGEPLLPPVEVEPQPPDQAPTDTTAPSDFNPQDPYPNAYPLLRNQMLETPVSERSIFSSPTFDTIIGRQQIEEKNAQNMYQAMQDEVGVFMQRTAAGQAQPTIRGLLGQQVLWMIDGIRMNNATYRSGPNQYFNTVDPGMVERIEIYRGAQSVLYGADALGGAINVITRSPSPWAGDYREGSFTEYYGTADSSSYSRLNVNASSHGAGVFTGGSYLNVRDLDTAGPLGRQPATNYSQYAGDVKVNYEINPDYLLTLSLQHFEQNDVARSDRFLPFVLGPPTNTQRPTVFDPQQRDLMYIRLQGVPCTAFYDAVAVTFSYAKQKEGNIEQRFNNNTPAAINTETRDAEFSVDQFGAQVMAAREFECAGKVLYGVDYYHDDVSAFRNRVQTSDPISRPLGPLDPQYPNGSTYDRVGAYLSWEYPLAERLTAITGVRYEEARAEGIVSQVTNPIPFERNYHDWIASFNLVYELTDYCNLVGGVTEGFRPPNLDDLTSENTVLQDGQENPSLNVLPEHAYNFDVGVKLDTPRLRGQAFFYWIVLDDNILREEVQTSPQVFSRGNFNSYIYGTEMSGEYLLNCGWSLYGNMWYTFGEDLVREEPLSRIPPIQGVLGCRWRSEDLTRYFDIYTWMAGDQDRYNSVNLQDSRFPVGGNPGYAVMGIRAGRAFGACDQHRVSVALENVTDKAFRPLGSGVDGAGFNAILAYELRR